VTENNDASSMISVLLPVHNAEAYLPLALKSLLVQSFKDFEIIAINDGSTDLSGEILNKYAKRDSRIRVFHRPQRGLVPTLNEGIDLANGQWIARMDADDIALPFRFELQLEQLLRTDADFCGGAVKCFGDTRATLSYPQSNEACGAQLLFGVPVAHPAVIGRIAAFKSLRYDLRFMHAEDYDLWQRAWESGYQFTNLRDIVLYYRVHKKQVSSKYNSEQNRMSDAVRIRHWESLCPDLGGAWFESKVSNYCLGNGSAASLIPGMLEVLSCMPDVVHDVYLRGCLGIFIRVAKRDPRSFFYWLKLYKSAKSNSWQLKFGGSFKLAILTIFPFRPESRIYAVLRKIRDTFVW